MTETLALLRGILRRAVYDPTTSTYWFRDVHLAESEYRILRALADTLGRGTPDVVASVRHASNVLAPQDAGLIEARDLLATLEVRP